MGITITDVAHKAGVSITTVSHVLNGTRYVSRELQDRVTTAMEELGYQRNVLARGLRRGETSTIGLIVPDNSNPFFAEILRLIEDIGFAHGYSVILCNSDGDISKEIAYTDVLFAKQVDGIIYIASFNSYDHMSKLARQEVPIVVVDRDVPLENADVVLVDNFQGGYDITRHLISLGHTRIACITGPSELTPSADRVHGYKKAMEEAGLSIPAGYLLSGDFRSRSGELAMGRLLRLPRPPTAVFACNDIMALGALQTLKQEKIPVPEQVSIVGFDDITILSMISPALTTVAQPIHELASISINLLLAHIQNESSTHQPQRVVLPTRLAIRESSSRYIGD